MTKPHKTLSQAIIMNSYWGKVHRGDTEFILYDGSRGTSQLANKTKDGATTKKGRIIQLMVISHAGPLSQGKPSHFADVNGGGPGHWPSIQLS